MASAYTSYKESKIEWVGKIPRNWSVTSVGKVYEITLGKMLQPIQLGLKDESVPYLKAMNVQDGYLKTNKIDKMYASPSELDHLKILSGDLLVCEGGEVARSVIVPKDLDGMIFQNSLHRVRGSKNYNVNFLHYYLIALRNSEFVDILVNKATIAHFTKEKFKSLKIALPNSIEQKEIVKFLNKKIKEIESLIVHKERLIEVLEEKRQSMITETVTKGLNPNVRMKDSGVEWIGEIPEHWERVRLKHLTKMKSGESIDSLDINSVGQYKVYGGGGFRGYTSKYTHRGEYVLIGRQGALCGNVTFASSEFWATEHAVVVEANYINIRYLRYLLEGMNLNQYSISAAQPGLSVSTILNLAVPVPTENEQIGIAAKLEGIHVQTVQLVSDIQSQIQKLKNYRQSLIYEAVTGKIDVRDFEVKA